MRKRLDSKIIVFLEVIALNLYGLVVCYFLYKQKATIKN